MLVLFDRKRLESALPNVPARTVEFVVTSDVRVLQPMHPPTQIAIGGRLEHEMKVIRHQTVSQHRHRHFHAGMGDRLEKSLVVAVFEEHLPPPIPPVDDVAANTANRGSRDSRHGVKLTLNRRYVNRKHARPL